MHEFQIFNVPDDENDASPFFLTDYFYYVANKAILQLLNFRAISHFTRYLFKAGLRNRRYTKIVLGS